MNEDELLDPTVKEVGFNSRQQVLPNATAVLVLGILSIVGCFLYGLPGIVCGIIAIALHKKDKLQYESNPQAYENSFKNSRGGFICGIIGLSLSAAYLLILLLALASVFRLGW